MPNTTPLQRDAPLAVAEIAGSSGQSDHLVWGHGWGQSSAAMLALAEGMKPFARSWLLDFPGFGKSPLPPSHWGTAEYADQVANWLPSVTQSACTWIGHSFGGRVGIQLAARHPGLLKGLVLIAAAGLPRRRSLFYRAQQTPRQLAFRLLKRLLPSTISLDRLRERMGSTDYRNAGPMRPVFTRVIQEDLADVARSIACPVLLIYGQQDTETPPEIGERLRDLIPHAELLVLPGLGHLDILTTGRHQVVSRIRRFLESLP